MADELIGKRQVAQRMGGAQGQQLIINAQYIKGFSFENPRAPQTLTQQTAPPSVEIAIEVEAESIGDEACEVVLTLKASAKAQNEPLFVVELAYGAIATIRNVPPAKERIDGSTQEPIKSARPPLKRKRCLRSTFRSCGGRVIVGADEGSDTC